MASLESFATAEDLAAAWRALSADETSRANVLLAQASNKLRQIGKNNSVDIDDKITADETGVFGENVKMVVEAAVQRVLAAPVEMAPDVTQFSQVATPYSESMSFGAGDSNSLYFKKQELELLGLKSVSGKSQISILKGVR